MPVITVERAVAHHVVACELEVVLVPVVKAHSLLAVGLKDLHLILCEFDHNCHMVVVAASHQPLQSACCVLCSHQKHVSCLSPLQVIFLQNPIFLFVEVLCLLAELYLRA